MSFMMVAIPLKRGKSSMLTQFMGLEAKLSRNPLEAGQKFNRICLCLIKRCFSVAIPLKRGKSSMKDITSLTTEMSKSQSP